MFVRVDQRVKGLVAAAATLTLAACNPLLVRMQNFSDLDLAATRYTGPPAAWVEVAVSGAPDHRVLALALVRTEVLTGPTDRSCGGQAGAVVPCTSTATGVQTPNQVDVPGDGSAYVPLITVWPEETVGFALVCIDPTTQELRCPDTIRLVIRAVDDGGDRLGDLVPAPVN